MNFIEIIDEKRMINDFLELAAIDAESFHEHDLCIALKEKFALLGVEMQEDDAAEKIGGNSGNLYGNLTGEAGINPIFFMGHLDRVKPGNAVQPQCCDGLISSSGDTVLAADDLVACVALLEACRVLKNNALVYPMIEMIFTVAEEVGLKGAKHFDFGTLKSDFGFALDSDGPIGTIVVAGGFHFSFKAEINGLSAHAGVEPEKGISAIKVASDAISKMQLGRIDEATTANIGTIHGGTAANIVPGRIIMEGEVRSLERCKAEHHVAGMRLLLEQSAALHRAEVKIEIEESYTGFSIQEDEEVVIIAKKAADMIGVEAVLKSSCGGSDVNIVNASGKRAANLGAGYKKIHSCDECIEVADMVKLTQYVLAIITQKAAQID